MHHIEKKKRKEKRKKGKLTYSLICMEINICQKLRFEIEILEHGCVLNCTNRIHKNNHQLMSGHLKAEARLALIEKYEKMSKMPAGPNRNSCLFHFAPHSITCYTNKSFFFFIFHFCFFLIIIIKL
jgi:hypothetical protein